MHLGPDDPAPAPPPAPVTKKDGDAKEQKIADATGVSKRAVRITLTVTLLGFASALAAQTGNGADAAKYRALVDKYCVTCHNKKTASPGEHPVRLDAGFDDLTAMPRFGRESFGS